MMMAPKYSPKYPDVEVRLHSRNPLALVSAVRSAMRVRRIAASEIDRFTAEAMSLHHEEPERIQDVCSEWARIKVS